MYLKARNQAIFYVLFLWCTVSMVRLCFYDECHILFHYTEYCSPPIQDSQENTQQFLVTCLHLCILIITKIDSTLYLHNAQIV